MKWDELKCGEQFSSRAMDGWITSCTYLAGSSPGGEVAELPLCLLLYKDKMLIKIVLTKGLILIYIHCYWCIHFVTHHSGFIWFILGIDLAQTEIGEKMHYGTRIVSVRINGINEFLKKVKRGSFCAVGCFVSIEGNNSNLKKEILGGLTFS